MQRRLVTWKFHHRGVTRQLENPTYPNVGTLVFFLDTRTDLWSFVTEKRFPNLELLHVDARTDVASLRALLTERALPGLILSNLGIPDFETLLDELRGEELRRLRLAGLGIHGDRVKALGNLARFGKLEWLRLAGARLGTVGGALLGGLELPGLRRVELDDCGLGGSGLRGLAGLGGLTELRLGANRLESAHFEALAQGASAGTLTRLEIHNNRGVDDEAFVHLAGLAALKLLGLSGTNITREAAEAFEAEREVEVIGKDSLRSGRVVVVGPGKSDTPDELEDAVDDQKPGKILSMLKAGELAWDGEYTPLSHDDWTRPFHLIAGLGGTKEVKKAVEDHQRNIDERDLSQRTPLMFACIGPDLRPWDGEADRPGSDKTVRRLLELGADVHCADKQGRTALHHAVHVGAEKCVRRLLRSGAKDVPDGEGTRPSELARSFEHTQLVPLLERAT